jgi:hypothetical protein
MRTRERITDWLTKRATICGCNRCCDTYNADRCYCCCCCSAFVQRPPFAPRRCCQLRQRACAMIDGSRLRLRDGGSSSSRAGGNIRLHRTRRRASVAGLVLRPVQRRRLATERYPNRLHSSVEIVQRVRARWRPLLCRPTDSSYVRITAWETR